MFKARYISGALAALLAVLLVAMQSVSSAHALQHGDEPHDHDGVPCAVSILADRNVDLLPQDNVSFLAPVFVEATLYRASLDPLDFSLTASPSARAPPTA
ncbi:MAG: hypothetical protein MRY59_13230 [Aquisalinus sp.]|nr:hypothetical protein [Aquisalinus sp.]